MEADKSSAGKTSGDRPRQTRAEKLLDAKVDTQIEKLVKSLGHDVSPDQKLLQLAKQVVESERESNRRAQLVKQNEKCLEQVLREKENLQKEYNKGVLMRDKLEQVCREQQKLMKSIKSECTTRIREEEEKRKETQAHFQKSINDIFTTLGKNNEENAKLKEANLEMTKKFKFLAEQYELREKQLGKINEQITLESQLNDAKQAKAKMESTIEKEILLKEKEAILIELLSAKQVNDDMLSREQVYKGQLNMYTEKYAEFQTSLQKSNDVFSTYKTEIEQMSKRTKKLEKETADWRSKYEKSNRALLSMIDDKQAADSYTAQSQRQIAQLQKLCRTLQAERTALIAVLEANNLERPAMPELPPLEPAMVVAEPPKSADKLDLMTRNCAELKKSLAALQGQMNALEKGAAQQKPAATNGTAAAGNGAATAAAAKKPRNRKPRAVRVAASASAAEAAVAVAAAEGDEVAAESTEAISEVAEAVVEAVVATNGSAESESVVNGGAPTNGNVEKEEEAAIEAAVEQISAAVETLAVN